MPSLSLNVGDLFEPDVLPWWVRVGTRDTPINFPLPGLSERKPWGVVTKLEHNGDVHCTVVASSWSEGMLKKGQTSACVLAKDVHKLRPKSTPSLEQVLA